MSVKLLTIVTVVYNDRKGITETIESVIRNKSDEIEYVVIDGGSTDGTLEIINNYQTHIDIFVSEPDNGIYDAMNKSIKLGNGNYILNINSGDILLINPLEHVSRSILESKTLNLILFNVLQSNGKLFRNKFSSEIKIHNTVHHQGILYRLDKHRLYDLRYVVFSDYDYNVNIYKSNAQFLKIEKTISKHDLGGISHSGNHFNENFEIVEKNYGKLYVKIAFIYFKLRGLRARLSKI